MTAEQSALGNEAGLRDMMMYMSCDPVNHTLYGARGHLEDAVHFETGNLHEGNTNKHGGQGNVTENWDESKQEEDSSQPAQTKRGART